MGSLSFPEYITHVKCWDLKKALRQFAKGNANSMLQDYLLGDTVRYKKYFYAIDLRQAIEEPLYVRKITTEGEENSQMLVIKEFVKAEKDYAALNRIFLDTIASGKEHS